MKFSSKFDPDKLVEFTREEKSEKTEFGRIASVTFWRSDAVNYACSYGIQLLNSEEVVPSVNEHLIIRKFLEST